MTTGLVLAHLGGLPEAATVGVPLAVIVGLLVYAKVRGPRAEDDDEPPHG